MPRALSLCFVSMHTSSAMEPGSGDAGGMNVVERAQAKAPAELGHRVELITRRTDPDARLARPDPFPPLDVRFRRAREAVAHGVSGQLMDSRQPEDWALALRRLLSEPGLLQRMAPVSRVHARPFDWHLAALRLVKVYDNLLGQS